MQDQLTAMVQKLREDTDRYKRAVMQSSMAAKGAFLHLRSLLLVHCKKVRSNYKRVRRCA